MENKQIVYIDESNILSSKGSSIYVCLYIKYLDKENVNQKIKNIEMDLKIHYLHWVDMPWKLRLTFSEKIKDLNFICRIVVYKNPIDQKNSLLNFLVKVISFKDNVSEIFIDGKQSKRFQLKFKTFLRKRGIKVYKISFVNDKNEPLIRLADFIAGFYRSYLDNGGNENIIIYKTLKHKIKILN